MKKKILFLFILMVIMGLVLGYVYKKDSDYKKTDAYKFKVEYESLNGKLNDYEKEYRSVNIDKENKIKYASAKDIVKKIENNETFVVYFGFSKCPWCRSMIENLIELSNSYDQTIYYVDVLEIRDKIEVVDGELKTTTKGY